MNDIMWSKKGKKIMLNLADDESIELNVNGKDMIIINNSRFKNMKENNKKMTKENNDNKRGLEADLIDWNDWNDADHMSMCFHDVTLKVDIGKHKKGDKFDWCIIDYKYSNLELGIDNEETEKFKLKLLVIKE